MKKTIIGIIAAVCFLPVTHAEEPTLFGGIASEEDRIETYRPITKEEIRKRRIMHHSLGDSIQTYRQRESFKEHALQSRIDRTYQHAFKDAVIEPVRDQERMRLSELKFKYLGKEDEASKEIVELTPDDPFLKTRKDLHKQGVLESDTFGFDEESMKKTFHIDKTPYPTSGTREDVLEDLDPEAHLWGGREYQSRPLVKKRIKKSGRITNFLKEEEVTEKWSPFPSSLRAMGKPFLPGVRHKSREIEEEKPEVDTKIYGRSKPSLYFEREPFHASAPRKGNTQAQEFQRKKVRHAWVIGENDVSPKDAINHYLHEQETPPSEQDLWFSAPLKKRSAFANWIRGLTGL